MGLRLPDWRLCPARLRGRGKKGKGVEGYFVSLPRCDTVQEYLEYQAAPARRNSR